MYYLYTVKKKVQTTYKCCLMDTNEKYSQTFQDLQCIQATYSSI